MLSRLAGCMLQVLCTPASLALGAEEEFGVKYCAGTGLSVRV